MTPTDAFVAGTAPRPGRPGPPARFAVELRDGQDPLRVAAQMTASLATLDPVVSPQSALERGVLVVELPGRSLDGVDPAAAFTAAYALAEDVDAANAEPDLPTAWFPEPDHTDGIAGLSAFPGCTVGEEPLLAKDWALEAVRARDAWEFSVAVGRPVGGAGIVVAQPDTGVIAHPELDGVDRAGGFDTLDDDADPTDPLDGLSAGHGTGTASVVVSPMSLQVIGSAPQARHMPIRAIESVVRVSQVTVARAVDWAVQNGAHVITMSLGGLPAFSLDRALRRAVAADVVVLAAAGNCVREVVWPARYGDCIAVAGVNATDGRWRGTCRGSAVDVSAPAQNVWRAQRDGTVGQGEGTSFAVALTAGVAACWLAHHGRANLIAEARARGETLQQMFLRLARASARVPAQWDSSEMGAGIVDARALLEAGLDRGRGAAPATAVDSIASLIAATAGADAMLDAGTLDRFGPEIANALLGGPAGGEQAMAARSAPTTPVSPQLATVLAGTVLGRRLGL